MATQRAVDNVEVFQSSVGRKVEQYINQEDKAATKSALKRDFSLFAETVFKKSIDTLTRDDLNSLDYDKMIWYREELKKTLENASVNRYMSSVKTILTHLKVRNEIESDLSYLKELKALPIRSESIEYMPLEIVDRYIHEAGHEKHYPYLKQAIIMFAVDTGLRLNECLEFTKGQFIEEEGHVFFRGWGKGDKEYSDKISYEVYEFVMRHTLAYHNDDQVFAPLTRKMVTDMMTRFKERLGYSNRNFSFHSLKKTAVTHAYRETNDVLEAQRKGRHSSLETTRRYLKEEEYGLTGAFSTRGKDDDLYKKVTHEELLKAIEGMNKSFKHILNNRIESVKIKNVITENGK